MPTDDKKNKNQPNYFISSWHDQYKTAELQWYSQYHQQKKDDKC